MCGGCRPAALLASSSLLRLIERRRDAQMVGKWHMGEFRRAYTPTFRGYDTFLGCELHTAPPPPPRRVCQSLRCRQPRADRECVHACRLCGRRRLLPAPSDRLPTPPPPPWRHMPAVLHAALTAFFVGGRNVAWARFAPGPAAELRPRLQPRCLGVRRELLGARLWRPRPEHPQRAPEGGAAIPLHGVSVGSLSNRVSDANDLFSSRCKIRANVSRSCCWLQGT